MGNISDVKVSVVVPTYNVEPYFRECLDSLAAQTLIGIEFIIVNDGSPDNCGSIADEYASKDDRFRVIHKKNGGYGSAVNLGFEQAKGEYVGIVEPDDWIETEMYEKLYTQAKRLDADVCKCGFYRYNSFEAEKNIEFKSALCDIHEITNDRAFTIAEHPELTEFHSSIWTNIYRRNFLVESGIKINDTPGASYQDLPMMIESFCKARRIAVVPESLYHWRVEPGQQSSTNATGRKLVFMADNCIVTNSILKECGLFEQLKDYICLHYYNTNIVFFQKIDKEYKQEYRDKLRFVFLPFFEGSPDYRCKFFSSYTHSFVKDYIVDQRNCCKWVWSGIRRKFIQLHLNRHHQKLSLFGYTIFCTDQNK